MGEVWRRETNIPYLELGLRKPDLDLWHTVLYGQWKTRWHCRFVTRQLKCFSIDKRHLHQAQAHETAGEKLLLSRHAHTPQNRNCEPGTDKIC